MRSEYFLSLPYCMLLRHFEAKLYCTPGGSVTDFVSPHDDDDDDDDAAAGAAKMQWQLASLVG